MDICQLFMKSAASLNKLLSNNPFKASGKIHLQKRNKKIGKNQVQTCKKHKTRENRGKKIFSMKSILFKNKPPRQTTSY